MNRMQPVSGSLRLHSPMRCRAFCASLPVVAVLSLALMEPAFAETLPDALVDLSGQSSTQCRARAAARGGRRRSPGAFGISPATVGTGGLQQVRVLFFDNTIQTA